MQLTLPAPAKLNLFLHILGQRPDGYHELQTVFQLLNFGDTLHFELRKDKKIRLFSDMACSLEENLIWRAAQRLQQQAQVALGVDIHLEKKLPVGAGLGGGSSNAATTLVALNQLWETRLSIEKLAALGQLLGADVPVFVCGKTSWAEGIGEKLTPIDRPQEWYVVLTPPCHVITAEIFAHSQLTRNTPRIKMADFLEDSKAEYWCNDFEPLVRALYPPVAEALDWLSQVAPSGKAYLTGSGSSVFARFADARVAEQICSQRPASFAGFVAKSMNRSPLFFELDKM